MQIVERDIFLEIEKYLETDEIIVLTGHRQTGKTTTLEYFFEKIKSNNKILLDLENVLNRKYFEENDYERIKSAFEFQGIDFAKKSYIFLDEIQFVKNIPSIVKYFKDHYQTKFFLTGSASFYLKNLFSESLSGRKYIFHIYPLSFREFIKFKGYKPVDKFSSGLDSLLDKLFKEYLDFGGFPGVVLKDNSEEKKKKLKDIFSSYYEMEIVRLRDFSKLSRVRDALFLILSRSASLLDITKLSREIGVTRITLTEYIDFFEKTFFFDFVKPFSQNKDVEMRKRRKIYPVDVGLAKIFGVGDIGKLFEIAIYQNLRIKNSINYYRKKNGNEIDFIVNKNRAIEAKVSSAISDTARLKRMTGNLKGIKQYNVVTLKRQELNNIEWAPHFCLKL